MQPVSRINGKGYFYLTEKKLECLLNNLGEPSKLSRTRLLSDRPGDVAQDRYGRPLPYIYAGGENFNSPLIREGYAHA